MSSDEAAPTSGTSDVAPSKSLEERREEKRGKALSYIRERFPEPPPCAMGHQTNWIVTDPVQLYPVESGPFGPVSYPVFQLVCPVCGYTMLFNAVVAGVLPPDESGEGEAAPREQE